jgi:hypothetical protein
VIVRVVPLDELADDIFYASVWARVIEKARAGYKMERLWMDPPEIIDGERFRFVRLWVEGEQEPYTWQHPY